MAKRSKKTLTRRIAKLETRSVNFVEMNMTDLQKAVSRKIPGSTYDRKQMALDLGNGWLVMFSRVGRAGHDADTFITLFQRSKKPLKDVKIKSVDDAVQKILKFSAKTQTRGATKIPLLSRIRALEARAANPEYTAEKAEAIIKRVLSIFRKFSRRRGAKVERPDIGRISVTDYKKRGRLKGSGVASATVELGSYEQHPVDMKSLVRQVENAAGTALKKTASRPGVLRMEGDSGFRVDFRALKGTAMRIDFSQDYQG